MEHNKSDAQTRLEGYLPGVYKFVNAAGVDCSCSLFLGEKLRGEVWANTVDRYFGDAVFVFSKVNGIYKFHLTNFRIVQEDEHLSTLRSFKGKADTVIIVSFAYFKKLELFYDQINFRLELAELGYESYRSLSKIDFSEFYRSLHNSGIIYHIPTGAMIFDARRDFRNAVQDIFQVRPVMWYVPLLIADLGFVKNDPYEFQLCVQRKVDPIDGIQQPRIYVPGTGLEVYIP